MAKPLTTELEPVYEEALQEQESSEPVVRNDIMSRYLKTMEGEGDEH